MRALGEFVENVTVGPVFENSGTARSLVNVLRRTHPSMSVTDEGSYLRILVKNKCILRKDLVEKELGAPFHLPQDLEAIMPAFKGTFTVTDSLAVWSHHDESL